MDTGLIGARGSCCGESRVPEIAFEDSSRAICVPQASGDLESHWAFRVSAVLACNGRPAAEESLPMNARGGALLSSYEPVMKPARRRQDEIRACVDDSMRAFRASLRRGTQDLFGRFGFLRLQTNQPLGFAHGR